MTKMLENEMLTPVASEPEEQDADELYDLQRADNDFADLRAELVAITRLQAIESRIDSLGINIRKLLIGKPRG